MTFKPGLATCPCGFGSEQSPIDLTEPVVGELPKLEFDYRTTSLSIQNTGYTIQVDTAPGSSFTLEGERHELKQFHFHTHSEHSVDGKILPLEMHLVHQTDSGEISVIGIFFQAGNTLGPLTVVMSNLPKKSNTARTPRETLDLNTLLPTRRESWRYKGSLTTPPYSEGVSWVIMTEILVMSSRQLANFREIFPNNYRELQPIGNRVLQRG